MTEGIAAAHSADDGRGWRRALALFAFALGTSVVQPTVLIAVPLLGFLMLRSVKGRWVLVAVAMVSMVILIGVRDALWFVERAWAISVGGAFVGITILAPNWRLTSLALFAVGASAVTWAGLLATGTNAWASIDWSVTDRLRAGFATWTEALVVLRQGEALSPAAMGAIYQTLEVQTAIFPAMVGLESMAALAVSWWVYSRLAHDREADIGPVSGFGFNDHLVWLLLTGLALLAAQLGDGLTRLGANLSVFMGALYALRGAGVVLFVSGGLSLFSYVMFALGLLFAPLVVLGFAVIIGMADTWLDLRARVGELAA
jgi:hypothetical protein